MIVLMMSALYCIMQLSAFACDIIIGRFASQVVAGVVLTRQGQIQMVLIFELKDNCDWVKLCMIIMTVEFDRKIRESDVSVIFLFYCGFVLSSIYTQLFHFMF